MNALTSALFVVCVSALALWARPRQPHWVSRDRQRFIAMACALDNGRGRPGRWTRVHGRIVDERVRLRQSFLSASTMSGTYTVSRREESTDSRVAIFTLGEREQVHLKCPRRSPLAGTLQSMLPHI